MPCEGGSHTHLKGAMSTVGHASCCCLHCRGSLLLLLEMLLELLLLLWRLHGYWVWGLGWGQKESVQSVSVGRF